MVCAFLFLWLCRKWEADFMQNELFDLHNLK